LPVSFISCASKHVDNLGAYSIPSETGLLIPSDCNSVANPQSTIMPQPEYEQASPNRKRHTGYVIRGLRNGGIFVRHTALSTTFGGGCDLEDLDREYSDRSSTRDPRNSLPISRNGGMGVADSCWSVCV